MHTESPHCQASRRGAYWKQCALFYFVQPAMKTLMGLMLAGAMGGAAAQDYAAARAKMADEIAAMARDTAGETARAAFSPRVMQAINSVERHRFVAAGDEAHAYRNSPLAIGNGQTISQPYIVALMSDLMALTGGETVLEIGTGSGYQAAVLAQLAARVYSVEIVEPLGKLAAQRLAAAGYRNVVTRIGDGYQGWRDAAPFDAIMVTAAAREVPPALIEQLKPGGRLVIPLGAQNSNQQLLVLTKAADGTTQTRRVLAVRFVPLTGGPGGHK
jgi:protein-L-isoaspartate(D-aspartate) O-methyltransferase